MVNWIAFFSQTGSEIVELCERVNRKPDLIVTNNFEKNIEFNPGVRQLDVTIMAGKHDVLMKYFDNQTVYETNRTIITLHGYLRIIPEHICNKYSIYNGHPGAINIYPELKGKDPQVRTWENRDKYNIVGSVVHRVTPGVDEGEIIKSVYVMNNNDTLDSLFSTLKMTSLTAWYFALREIGL